MMQKGTEVSGEEDIIAIVNYGVGAFSFWLLFKKEN